MPFTKRVPQEVYDVWGGDKQRRYRKFCNAKYGRFRVLQENETPTDDEASASAQDRSTLAGPSHSEPQAIGLADPSGTAHTSSPLPMPAGWRKASELSAREGPPSKRSRVDPGPPTWALSPEQLPAGVRAVLAGIRAHEESGRAAIQSTAVCNTPATDGPPQPPLIPAPTLHVVPGAELVDYMPPTSKASAPVPTGIPGAASSPLCLWPDLYSPCRAAGLGPHACGQDICKVGTTNGAVLASRCSPSLRATTAAAERRS